VMGFLESYVRAIIRNDHVFRIEDVESRLKQMETFRR
jgi:hypothetical protein